MDLFIPLTIILVLAIPFYFFLCKVTDVHSVERSVCFAVIVFLASFLGGILMSALFGGDDVGSITAVSVVGAFLGYAIMRNSGGSKSGDEKDKK